MKDFKTFSSGLFSILLWSGSDFFCLTETGFPDLENLKVKKLFVPKICRLFGGSSVFF